MMSPEKPRAREMTCEEFEKEIKNQSTAIRHWLKWTPRERNAALKAVLKAALKRGANK